MTPTEKFEKWWDKVQGLRMPHSKYLGKKAWLEQQKEIDKLTEGISNFIDWATGPESTIKDIPDKIWIPLRKLWEEGKDE